MQRVAIYVRISSDPDETELGVQDQLKDLRALAATLGWTVVVEYNENDVSAWRKRKVVIDGQVRYRVVRPLWTEMLAGARAGLFDAVLVLDLDRLAREPRDIEDLIELVNHHGVEVRSLTGTADLKPGGDPTMARFLVAVASKSSSDTARRVKRAHRRNAEAGKSRARRAFGYEPRPTGQLLKSGKPEHELVIVPAEAEAIRAACKVVLAGGSLYEIGQRWDELGLCRTGSGGTWRGRPGLVREVLLAPRNAGIAVVAGEQDRSITTRWEPIISPETYDQVRAVLTAPGRGNPGERAPRNSALSGIIICACGSPMRSWTRHGSRKLDPLRNAVREAAFSCDSFKTSGGRCYAGISATVLEELVEQAVVQVVLETDAEAFAPDPGDAAELMAVRGELAEVEAGRSDLAVLVAKRELTASSAAPALSALAERERLAQARWKAVQHRVAPAALMQAAAVQLVDLDDPDRDARADEILERYLALDLSVRRQIISSLLEVTILRAKQGGHDVRGRVQIRARATGELLAL